MRHEGSRRVSFVIADEVALVVDLSNITMDSNIYVDNGKLKGWLGDANYSLSVNSSNLESADNETLI